MLRKTGLMVALLVSVFALGFAAGRAPEAAAQTKSRLFELRIYTANDGKFEALKKRFRDGEPRIFEKNGIKFIGYWEAADPPQNTLIYILAHESREAATKSWEAFRQDPEFRPLTQESEKNGPTVAQRQVIFMNPADFSPIK